jgi:hypothetical protein
MNSTGTIESISIDYVSKKPKIILVLEAQNSIESLEEIKDDKLSIEIKKYRKKRSLDSNAYMWTIVEKIAEKLGVTKIEVYRDAIKEVGQCEVLPIKDEAVENFINAWKHNGQGWLCEIIGKSKIEGYTNITAYYRFEYL